MKSIQQILDEPEAFNRFSNCYTDDQNREWIKAIQDDARAELLQELEQAAECYREEHNIKKL